MSSQLVDKAQKMFGAANRKTVTALDEWLTLLGGPSDPPFSAGAQFPRGEWGRFFRLATTSLALTSAVLGLDSFVLPGGTHQIPAVSPLALKTVVGFALASLLYSIYSKAFGIAITLRQSFFCTSFLVLPWLPVLAMIKTAGRYLGWVVLIVCAYAALLRIGFSVAKGVEVVSGTSTARALLSLIPGAAIVVASIFT